MAGITWEEFLEGFKVGGHITNTIGGRRLEGAITDVKVSDDKCWGTITCVWTRWRHDKPHSKWQNFQEKDRPSHAFVIGLLTPLYRDKEGRLRYGHIAPGMG